MEEIPLVIEGFFGSRDEERKNNLLTALCTQGSRFIRILLSRIAEMQGMFADTPVFGMEADNRSRIRGGVRGPVIPVPSGKKKGRERYEDLPADVPQ